jgi:hypothetical protein
MAPIRQIVPLAHSRLLDLLNYDPDTGIWTWRPKIDRWGRASKKGGKPAGTIVPRGYRYLCVDGILHRSGRLAWFYVTGEWPKGQVDHKNLEKADDRWSNLRLADPAQQSMNKGLQSNNKCGFKGVHFVSARKSPKRYRSGIYVKGRLVLLGYFDNPFDASFAYREAAKYYFGEYAREA